MTKFFQENLRDVLTFNSFEMRPIDLYTGGEGEKTPMRKLIRVLSIKKEGVKGEAKEEKTDKRDLGSATL